MFEAVLKISLMLAVVAVGAPHALCAAHPGTVEAVVHHDHAAPVCEHCTGRSRQPNSDPSHEGPCPHCDISDQPYVLSAEVKFVDTGHMLTDWVLASVPLVTSAVDPVERAGSAERASVAHNPVSGRALTVLLGHLLL